MSEDHKEKLNRLICLLMAYIDFCILELSSRNLELRKLVVLYDKLADYQGMCKELSDDIHKVLHIIEAEEIDDYLSIVNAIELLEDVVEISNSVLEFVDNIRRGYELRAG